MAKAKFDIKTEATRPIYAGVGVTDLAVGIVREYVADVQKRFAGVQKDVQSRINHLEREPKALREQAATVVSARVDALSKDAQARRAAVEARVAELQKELQKALEENVASVGDTYADLARRGETLVGRIRNQQSSKATVSSARTTTAKAKTTKTQATKSAKATSTTAKKTAKKSARKTSTTAKKSSTAPKSSAKATATAAKKTASNAASATTDAAAKVGN